MTEQALNKKLTFDCYNDEYLIEFKLILCQSFNKAFNQEATNINFETHSSFGDLSIACFNYAKQLKINPQVIAEQWLKYIELPASIATKSVTGAYLNFTFNYHSLAKYLKKQIDPFIEYQTTNKGTKEKSQWHDAGDFGLSESHRRQKYLLNINPTQNNQILTIEFSSPNANKPLHLGHARNNAIGMFISRLSSLLGQTPITMNLINDRGIHICKSMLAYQADPKPKEPNGQKGDHLVGDYYVKYGKMEEKDPNLAKQAQELLKKWEDNDFETRALWRKLTTWVKEGINSTYLRTNIHFHQIYYESDIYQQGKEIVWQALNDGLVQKLDNGAVVIDLAKYNLDPKVLLRADGTSVYITQDIYGTIKKYQDYKPDKLLWVVGSEQIHHFKILFAILNELQLPWAKNCQHISYGMIRLPDGRMKSREGTSVDLDHLCDLMQEKARLMLLEKNPEYYKDANKILAVDSNNKDANKILAVNTNNKIDPNIVENSNLVVRSEQELNETAEAIGLAAINFFILRVDSTKEILFDIEESLSFDGMTGPYLQYTNVRIYSVLAKVAKMFPINSTSEVFHFKVSHINELYDLELTDSWQPTEKELLKCLFQFPSELSASWLNYNPAIIAQYCYELCRFYNKFYQVEPILNAQTPEIIYNRALLSLMTAYRLELCFHLLNIKKINRM